MTRPGSIRTFLLALAAVGLGACAAAPPAKNVTIGNWVVRSHDNPSTGRFSHCALSAKTGRPVNLYITMSALKALHLGFERRAWHWTAGSKVPVQVRVDSQPVENLTADAAQPDFLWVYWGDWMKPSLHQQDLRVGRKLALDAANQYFMFDLVGLRPAVRALARCAEFGIERRAGRPAG